MFLRNPDAAVVLFNYLNRTGSEGLPSSGVAFLEDAYVIRDPLISIRTIKHKAQPVGTFEIALAPTRNWTSFITPGSWLLIFMSPRKLEDADLTSSSEDALKMIGRVDTVRVDVQVDQESGARHTTYVVAGRDWAQVFETNVYLDPTASFKNDQPLAALNRLDFDEKLLRVITDKGQFNTTDITRFFIDLWGKLNVDTIYEDSPLDAKRYAAKAQFKVPDLLANHIANGETKNIADMIQIVAGKLDAYDEYKEADEAISMVDGHSVLGVNSVWQLMSQHMCPVVNELLADLRWEPNATKPSLALYKRIKPFAITKPQDQIDFVSANSTNLIDKTQVDDNGALLIEGGTFGLNTQKIISPFLNLKKHVIASEDVLSINAGTNWRDSVNFIEILPNLSWMTSRSDISSGIQVQNKNDSAVYDHSGGMIARDGLRPLNMSTTACPPGPGGAVDPDGMIQWLPVLKNWYFDTHKMLNGSVSTMGIGAYVSVGNNILFDSKLLGASDFSPNPGETAILAHVESVSHNFSYSEGGGRSFVSSFNFVRGVLTDPTGTKFAASAGLFALTDNAISRATGLANTTLVGGK